VAHDNAIRLTTEDFAVIDFLAERDFSAGVYEEMVTGDREDYLIMGDAERVAMDGLPPARFVARATYAYERADDPGRR
jgi:hypothetical protein